LLSVSNWPSTTPTPADIDNSGDVNVVDYAILANSWGWVGDGAQMVLIPPGEFLMGDHHDGVSKSLPVHAVYVDSFYMSRYEITNQQYCDYLNSAISEDLIEVRNSIVYAAPDGTNPYCDTYSYDADSSIEYSGDTFSVRIKDSNDMSDHPMVEVSWFGAVAYCNYYGYRLPTEAQWEYAARGGEDDPYYRYPWSDSIDVNMANFWDSGDPYETGANPWTTPIGYYDGDQIPDGADMANGYGLYDMAGNVSEWCIDWYDSNYYSSSPYDNPTGPASGTYRVLRGGCWYCDSTFGRVAYRTYYGQDSRSYHVGFRVVSDLE
jgi:formylglycine-generating enzyme required for sulfatase activity